MTTTAAALAAIKARLAANFSAIPVRWAGDNDGPVPDQPTAFAFAQVVIDREAIAAYGGGRGANEWRNDGVLEVVVLTPLLGGLEAGLGHAESIAAVFRGERFSGVSVDACTVSPAESDPDIGNYWRTIATCSFHFHRTG